MQPRDAAISPEAFLGHLKDSQPIFVVWAKEKKAWGSKSFSCEQRKKRLPTVKNSHSYYRGCCSSGCFYPNVFLTSLLALALQLKSDGPRLLGRPGSRKSWFVYFRFVSLYGCLQHSLLPLFLKNMQNMSNNTNKSNWIGKQLIWRVDLWQMYLNTLWMNEPRTTMRGSFVTKQETPRVTLTFAHPG